MMESTMKRFFWQDGHRAKKKYHLVKMAKHC
jgi:hypothetical protein